MDAKLNFLKNLEESLNRGSIPQFIITGYVIKGVIGRVNQFRFIVRSNDHNPAHFHIESKDGSVKAKYRIEPLQCLEGGNGRLDKFVEAWFSSPDNKKTVSDEWERFQEGKT